MANTKIILYEISQIERFYFVTLGRRQALALQFSSNLTTFN